jgi:hypothetical protein
MVEVIKRTSESYSDAFKARVVNGVGTEDTIAPKARSAEFRHGEDEAVVERGLAKMRKATAVTPEVKPVEEGPVLSAQTLLEMETGRKNLEKYKAKE